MYIKIVSDTNFVYPYLLQNLYEENSETSFPEMTEELLSSFGVYPIKENKPELDPLREKLVAGEPFFDNGWKVDYLPVLLSSEEVQSNLAHQNGLIEQQRAMAYQKQADPLYFQWKAGETIEDEWLNKRQEIRDRYPYIEPVVQ